MHQNQSTLMMAQGQNSHQILSFIAIEGRALVEAKKDV